MSQPTLLRRPRAGWLSWAAKARSRPTVGISLREMHSALHPRDITPGNSPPGRVNSLLSGFHPTGAPSARQTSHSRLAERDAYGVAAYNGAMPSLFAKAESDNLRQAQPLAARMRPQSLGEFAGQQHFLGEGKLLRRLLTADRLTSVIFYGPPGTGKTTLARLLATESRRKFKQLSAVTSGVKELRELLQQARDDLAGGGVRTLLFIDEIHRFNKSQQDALLPDVEEGIVTLVGATTSNPFFAVNSALVSRSQIFEFQPLSPEEIKTVVRRALADKERGLGNYNVNLHDDALEFLAQVSDGDARRALSALEVGVLSSLPSPSGRGVR